ncbi:MAG: hypothetical protein RL375_3231 [Pseudomonadota bacterium]
MTSTTTPCLNWSLVLALALCAGLPACTLPGGSGHTAAQASALANSPPAGRHLLLFGEQHDQVDHQRQIAAEVVRLADARRLRAVVMEMADSGRDTSALPPGADDAQVREALGWVEAGWPWARYAPVVMAAVRAGVPVHGGNLPRAQIRATMADVQLDSRVAPGVRQQLGVEVNEGHCGLLPLKQLPAMVRVQIARDFSMATTLARVSARVPVSSTADIVVLHAGERHVARDAGVLLHFDAVGLDRSQAHVVVFGDSTAQADERRPALLTPRVDECQRLREKLTGG